MTAELDFEIRLNHFFHYKLIKVKGEFITLEGYEDFRFFAHHVYDVDTLQPISDTWCISELTTGASIAVADSVPDCISIGLCNLNKVGAAGFRVKLQKQLQLTSPLNQHHSCKKAQQ
ncbi:MAG TPA: hypothetical protein PKM63_21770 [Panacibacter sp.]|nr:hypothetical protein [Panacibacter sp.]HNP46941.1 hypothetical protein [Panacibacter sp.]